MRAPADGDGREERKDQVADNTSREQEPGAAIICENLVKIYKTRDTEVLALQGLELTVEKGELMAIIGNSGSGKSTFLNMIGGLDRPSAGKLIVDGRDLFKLTEKELVAYKRDTVGFVWQNSGRNLLPYLTALENIEMPMSLAGAKARRERALMLLEMVGLSEKKNSRTAQLSGGEQQRIAIAIALANDPGILLADEPTGAVDVKTSAYILDVFRRINREQGKTIVIVTHDRQIARHVTRVAAIRDGKIASEQIMRADYARQFADVGSFAEEENAEAATHDEYAILDRAGRLQIPGELLEEAGIAGNKVRMSFRNGEIILAAPEKEE